MKILLDECLPHRLRNHLLGHECQTAAFAGFGGLENGDLLEAAEKAKFDVLLTADRGIEYQQEFGHRKIAMIILRANTSLALACPGTSEGRCAMLCNSCGKELQPGQAYCGCGTAVGPMRSRVARHRQRLGILWMVYASFPLFFGIWMFYATVILPRGQVSHWEEGIEVHSTQFQNALPALVSALVLVWGIVSLMAGRGLLKRASWAAYWRSWSASSPCSVLFSEPHWAFTRFGC